LSFDFEQLPMVPSPGSGQTLIDPYTSLPYVDTDPGPGDGVTDDCLGEIEYPISILDPPAHRSDGLPDLYPLNPAWGQVMVVRNANSADYSGVLLELTRRYARGWGLQGSYTWSRAVGDAEQFDQLLGDEPAILGEERSYLAYDQRHVVKVVGAVDTPWDWRVGGTVRWESGLPYSSVEAVQSFYGASPEYTISYSLPQLRYRYVDGKRNAHRNPGFWTLDARLAREFSFSGQRVFGLTLEVFNLLNDDTLRVLEVNEGKLIAVRRFGRRMQIGVRFAF
jgi:hypothetical protein